MTILRYFWFVACAWFGLACSSETERLAPRERVTQATHAAVAVDARWVAEAALPLALWNPEDGPLDGATVALDKERLVLVPPGGWATNDSFRAYVFVKQGAIWRYEDLVPEDDVDRNYRVYGRSVALSGDLMLVSSAYGGAPFVYRGVPTRHDPTLMEWRRGNELERRCDQAAVVANQLGLSSDTALVSCVGDGVHVYSRSDAGLVWQQRLSPPAGHAVEYGRAVAVDANTIAVASSGAVHLYARYRGRWHHQQSIAQESGAFAAALSLSGDTLAVAGGVSGTGPAASVYFRTGSEWTLQQELQAPGSGASGPDASISVSGDTLFFSPTGVAAYAYSRVGSTWSAAQPLSLGDVVSRRTVAVSQGNGVVTGPSSASIFEASGSTWRAREGVDIGSRHAIGNFGKMDISGSRAAVVGRSGRLVHLFVRSESRWREERLFHLLGEAYEPYIWLADEHLLVIYRGRKPGAAYAAPRVYSRGAESWSEAQELTTDDGAILDGGGAVFGDRIVLGDYRNQAAYVFQREGSRWKQAKKLVIPAPVPQEKFAWSLDMDEQRVIVGSPTARLNVSDKAEGVPGSAYVFRRAFGDWHFETKLTPLQPSNESFGNAVAIRDDMAAVSAPNWMLAGGAHVHAFLRGDTSWEHVQHVQPAKPSERNVFYGTEIGLMKDTLAIGSLAMPPGQTFVYARRGEQWEEEHRIRDSADATFGALVTATDGRLLIGGLLEPPRIYRRAGQVRRGGPCSKPEECATGHCAGGVCCNEACQEECRACANHLTNEPDGTCGMVVPGTRCGPDVLDCSTDSQTDYALASTCDAAGTCQSQSVACRDGMKCVEPGYCPWKCNAFGEARHDLCPDSTWCDAESGDCVPRKHGREWCSGDEECLSGQCKELVNAECVAVGGARCKRSVCLGTTGDECQTGEQCGSQFRCADGVCCESACTGVCESCNQEQAKGICTVLPKDQQPSGAKRCPGEGVCKPACDGMHRDACQPSTAICREAACDGNVVIVETRCDMGLCPAPQTKECKSILCDEQTKDCKRRCVSNDDCFDGVCENGSCVVAGPRCLNDSVLMIPSVGERQCPGRCEGNQCVNTCSGVQGCSDGYECVDRLCTPIRDGGVPNPEPLPDGGGAGGGDDGGDDDEGSCACRAAGSFPSGSARDFGILAVSVMLAFGARRRRPMRA